MLKIILFATSRKNQASIRATISWILGFVSGMLKKNRFILFAFLCLSLSELEASTVADSIQYRKQYSWFRKYINSIISDTTAEDKAQFLWYPTVAYAPETRWELGFSTLMVYYAKGDVRNRLSEVNGFSFYTFENQYGFWFDHALYSHQDKYFFLGKIRIQSFPLLYHGIGHNTPGDYAARVDANQITIRERVLRKVVKNFFIGLETELNRISRVNFKPSSSTTQLDLPLGSQGSSNLGVGFGVVYDNRHNVLNVRNGTFAEAAFMRYHKRMLSDFDFTTFLTDFRIFRPIAGKNVVFAAQAFSQFNFGDVPFNQLSLLGGESLMRGYYLGRFRDRKQVATQVEIRFLPLPLRFTKRLGAAIFGGAGNVFSSFDQFSTKQMIWSGGAGLRFLVFPKKDVYTRFDVAFTREKPGFYFFIGEAF